MKYTTNCVCCSKEFNFTKDVYYWIDLDYGSADYMFCSKECVFEYVKNNIVEISGDEE